MDDTMREPRAANLFLVGQVPDGTARVRIGVNIGDRPILSRGEALNLACWLVRQAGASIGDFEDLFHAVLREGS